MSSLGVFNVLRRVAAIAGLTFAVAGCQPGVGATVTGTISINGRPAPAGILVRFQPQVPKSSASIGVTNAEGRYDLRFNARMRGVMPGESVVSLEFVEEPGLGDGADTTASPRRPHIPPAYGRQSTLKKTVKPGANVIDIAVELPPAS